MKEELREYYDSEFSNYENLKEEVEFALRKFLGKSAIKIHNIQSRVKQFESFITKIENLELKEIETIKQTINDIVGVRVICLFISDMEEIKKVIETNFQIIHEDNKLGGRDVSSFGYFSSHFTCKLKDEHKGPRYDSIKNIAFEIQVRTISMDAWANISHYLDYKSEIEIPQELKRDFFALSGLFYVADTHFEMFFKNKKEQNRIATDFIKTNTDVEINFETLNAYLNKRFPNRRGGNAYTMSILTQELSHSGFKTIKELDTRLTEIFKHRNESKLPPNLSKVGIVRFCLMNFDKVFKRRSNAFRKSKH